jgi:isocitrate/isopropylmalate dehydrogenase
MRVHNIAAIPADGIGPEVIEAGADVLAALARRNGTVDYKLTFFDWGSDYYKKHGVMMPADGLEQLKPFDAIYFGAVGAPDVPDHITLWGLRLPICQGFDQYANVRRQRSYPASRHRCAMSVSATSIGSSCVRIRKASILAMVAVPTADFQKRSAPRCPFSPAWA